MEKRVAEIEAHYTKRAKKLDATFAAGDNSNPFLSAYKSYGINGIDSLVVKGFKQLICPLAKVAAESQEAGNITPTSSTDHKRKGAYALFKKRFKVALGCMAIRTQTELMVVRGVKIFSCAFSYVTTYFITYFTYAFHNACTLLVDEKI